MTSAVCSKAGFLLLCGSLCVAATIVSGDFVHGILLLPLCVGILFMVYCRYHCAWGFCSWCITATIVRRDFVHWVLLLPLCVGICSWSVAASILFMVYCRYHCAWGFCSWYIAATIVRGDFVHGVLLLPLCVGILFIGCCCYHCA